MSDPDYMSCIAQVARRCADQSTTISKQIIDDWIRYESFAREDKYDILVPGSQCRSRGLGLISRLYEAQPDATHHDDCTQLREKNASYGGSWCARGGVGAFFTLARKADRYIEQVRLGSTDTEDTLGDLRRYLILIEAWHVASETLHENMGWSGQKPKDVTVTMTKCECRPDESCEVCAPF